jgi:glycerophosphoryl diester phosphodiesterase
MIRGLRRRSQAESRCGEHETKPGALHVDRIEHRDTIDLPPVIGHRGAAGSAPENTLAGLRRAKALDCRWVEFDVRLTADGQPVLLHDDRLQRTTDGRGKISTLPLEAVRGHDAGAWFGPCFAGERVPTLEEALMVLAELGVGANIELKTARGREADTGTVVADVLARRWPAQLPAPLISSFHSNALAAAQARAPGIARGLLFRAVPRNWRAMVDRLGCATIHVDHRRLHPALASEIRRAGYGLLAYTVNDPARAGKLFDWGTTSVFSDVPRRLLDALVCPTGRNLLPADLFTAGIPG